MPKFKVLVVANNEEVRINLKRRLSKEEEIALIGFTNLDTNVLQKISGYGPHVVLLVQSSGDSGVMEIAQMIYQGFPGCAIVLFTNIQHVLIY